ncbi:HsdM family class I SAM-dependent methyltransferase [Pedobacter sp.]|uniref:HsdM family class I SAM-dependent methyltransferase n=1 Tax=Pedobacter sp. TaxID=1411316 RepID=UPI003BAD6602
MTVDQKKKLAAYYTPQKVTNILSDWAIRSPNDLVLEPSFGGCNFLISSMDTLDKLGSVEAMKNIYGFDIDAQAFRILSEIGIDTSNFILGDFLTSNELIEKKVEVNVILGNPPYLPIQKLEEEYKKQLIGKFKNRGFSIPKRSSLWVYFVIQSFEYLRMGGRMAWVLPDSLFFTEYGKIFLSQLQTHFLSVQLVRVDERYFIDEGTYEKTVFLLCDGHQQGNCNITYSHYPLLVDALKDIQKFKVKKYRAKKPPLKIIGSKKRNSKLKQVTLGDVFDIRIGIVTGASKLLLFDTKKITKTSYFPEFTYPIISKGIQLSGLQIDKKSLLTDELSPIYIIDAIKMEHESPELFSKFLLSFPNETLLNETFRKRTRLFSYDDFKHPDAFLTYFSQGMPKLILNARRELNCTNSIHRLYLKPKFSNSLSIVKFFAMQTFSGYFQDETKSIAREYGNSIFKFEPRDARKIPFLIPKKIDHLFESAVDDIYNTCLRLISENKSGIAKSEILNFLSSLTR